MTTSAETLHNNEIKGKRTVSPPKHSKYKGWQAFLSGVQASDLFTKRDFTLISVNSEDTIPCVLQVLKDCKITSVPVWDDAKEGFIGFVDILDIICYLFTNIKEEDTNSTLIEWSRGIIENDETMKTPVKEIVNISEMNPWCPVYMGKPLLSIMDMFSSLVQLHRVPIIDDQGNVMSVISRSRVIEFLNLTIPKFSEIACLTVSQCFPMKHVESVTCDTSVFDAFYKIYTTKITGLAVVNSQGLLVGNISASDIKAIVIENLYSSLQQPLNSLLKRSSEVFGKPFRALYCYPDDTLQQVMQIFTSEKIHRLYIMDANKRPLGVISLGDVINVCERIDTEG